METQEIKNITINSKYSIRFERTASAGKADGFKVETNGDSLEEVKKEAKAAYEWACEIVKVATPLPAVKTASTEGK